MKNNSEKIMWISITTQILLCCDFICPLHDQSLTHHLWLFPETKLCWGLSYLRCCIMGIGLRILMEYNFQIRKNIWEIEVKRNTIFHSQIPQKSRMSRLRNPLLSNSLFRLQNCKKWKFGLEKTYKSQMIKITVGGCVQTCMQIFEVTFHIFWKNTICKNSGLGSSQLSPKKG